MGNSDILDLIIEFGGGAELLFGNVKKHKVQLIKEESSKWTIRKLLPWIKKNLLKERPELFIQDESVRPGILVLVNDADWELLLRLQNKLLLLWQASGAKALVQQSILKSNHFLYNLDLKEGELDYELKNNDNILFISTLHGG